MIKFIKFVLDIVLASVLSVGGCMIVLYTVGELFGVPKLERILHYFNISSYEDFLHIGYILTAVLILVYIIWNIFARKL